MFQVEKSTLYEKYENVLWRIFILFKLLFAQLEVDYKNQHETIFFCLMKLSTLRRLRLNEKLMKIILVLYMKFN